jgi:alpha,alpha-trehalase
MTGRAAAGIVPRGLATGARCPNAVRLLPQCARGGRAADFSSRWLRDPRDLRTLETVELVPVDLNSLLYHAELVIAALRAFRGRAEDDVVARRFRAAADARRRALLALAWDDADGFFYDVRWRTAERVRDRPTLAAAAPLYFGLASAEQGRAVAARLERDFLRPGGLVTTTIASGQQWDAPNGWAPLQWQSAEGVRRYGARTWPRPCASLAGAHRAHVAGTGRMMEVRRRRSARPAGGGGNSHRTVSAWSNGVALAFAAQRSVSATARA